MEEKCLFCTQRNNMVYDSIHGFAVFDKYPVTKYHALIIPKRHIHSFFELTENEYLDCMTLIKQIRQDLCQQDEEITGFNIGVNDGQDAGQTVNHCHIHLIPRRKNDVKNPRGGIRHVIPGKGNYESITPIDIQEEKFKIITA